MMLSDEKITHTSHILFNSLINKGLIKLKVEEQEVRREIKRSFIQALKIGESIDEVVRRKLQSFSKKVVEGSPEWNILYKKFFEEEEKKRFGR
ncbi:MULTISPECIES: DUF507 family protein [Thermodesulfovibrio]|jgi:hypothetical protein|uniref:DUF507 domain-containing protein n=3 Tax=Thermodesulfovibrio yellowstonii TaxID=28262 RepID=B5YK73_THEYD|nr:MULTISPECIES: DUF507 family protein [Thermodesulfovibrio]ACI21708.1 conserved hypothetical protein [Thermodesulfovibrio yellowstonii DSM 11347]MDI6865321.1 DUF507 family protein [Thermodesulfovibrio yellowstonii]GLI53813.1 hypothetical protein TISLANDTSLP1_15060 [Thermodesulfovibrio islandicus]